MAARNAPECVLLIVLQFQISKWRMCPPRSPPTKRRRRELPRLLRVTPNRRPNPRKRAGRRRRRTRNERAPGWMSHYCSRAPNVFVFGGVMLDGGTLDTRPTGIRNRYMCSRQPHPHNMAEAQSSLWSMGTRLTPMWAERLSRIISSARLACRGGSTAVRSGSRHSCHRHSRGWRGLEPTYGRHAALRDVSRAPGASTYPTRIWR
jgi:hypothetical protein